MGTETKNKMKACRCDIGITQQRMAQDLALDIQSVNRYENGKRDPSLATALRIAAYFNKTVEEIFALQDQK